MVAENAVASQQQAEDGEEEADRQADVESHDDGSCLTNTLLIHLLHLHSVHHLRAALFIHCV
jgi:hypothetical protein